MLVPARRMWLLTDPDVACSTFALSPAMTSSEKGLMPEVVSLGTTLLSVIFSWMLQGLPLMEMLVGVMICSSIALLSMCTQRQPQPRSCP